MTDRIFQQHAQAYGSTPAFVVCQIDSNTVFSGSIPTVDQPWPVLPNSEFLIPPLAWSWQDSADFAGTKQISITVTGSPVLLGQTFANYPSGNAANLDVFSSFYAQEIDGVTYFDPFTDEAIDGVPQSGPFHAETPGQWWWRIPVGSTFSATMHITAVSPQEDSPQ